MHFARAPSEALCRAYRPREVCGGDICPTSRRFSLGGYTKTTVLWHPNSRTDNTLLHVRPGLYQAVPKLPRDLPPPRRSVPLLQICLPAPQVFSACVVPGAEANCQHRSCNRCHRDGRRFNCHEHSAPLIAWQFNPRNHAAVNAVGLRPLAALFTASKLSVDGPSNCGGPEDPPLHS
jgi:hypothetical protein